MKRCLDNFRFSILLVVLLWATQAQAQNSKQADKSEHRANRSPASVLTIPVLNDPLSIAPGWQTNPRALAPVAGTQAHRSLPWVVTPVHDENFSGIAPTFRGRSSY